MIFTIPRSNGEDNAPLLELNTCHGPGRGHPCVGPGAPPPNPLAGSRVTRFDSGGVPTDAIERVFGQVRSMRRLALAMVGDVTSTTFDVTCRYEAWRDEYEHRDKEAITLLFAGADGTNLVRNFIREPDGSLVAHHEMFEVGEHAPPGIGKEVMRGSVREYQRLGVDQVKTYADCDVGSYAWARYGFLPTDAPATNVSLARHLEETLSPTKTNTITDRIRGSRVERSYRPTAAEVTNLRRTITEDDPESIWRVAAAKGVNGFPLGKVVLMDWGWSAQLDLHNSRQMARFHQYVGG